ncbi:uncharacterized protein TNCV_4309241 [Trichonephila clavipes]|nr:uncharacterized protein TNCV_4309241 [Trichonephila clavipes]
MRFHFYLNASRRSGLKPTTDEWIPSFIPPTTPSLQIAIHSPYFLPSPYNDGSTFLGGRSYELKVQMEETHRLPSPYQTHCTDYLKTWRENGGTGPINQIGIVQKCRADMYNELWGCVPLNVDYPHNYSICRNDFKKCKN